jgi:hypothetical protein
MIIEEKHQLKIPEKVVKKEPIPEKVKKVKNRTIFEREADRFFDNSARLSG